MLSFSITNNIRNNAGLLKDQRRPQDFALPSCVYQYGDGVVL